MVARPIEAGEAGLPRFDVTAASPADVFDLDSHSRAREALDFGLSVAGIGFNIFVIGDDRARRMTATMAYLEDAMQSRPAPADWIYVANFKNPAAPTPHRLPAGMGRKFCEMMAEFVTRMRESLGAAFGSDAFQARFAAMREAAQAPIAQEVERVRATARGYGLELVEGPDGGMRIVRPQEQTPGAPAPPPLPDAAQHDLSAAFGRLQRRAIEARAQLTAAADELSHGIVDEVASPMLDAIGHEFSGLPGLAKWLAEVKLDILENPQRFRTPPADAQPDTKSPGAPPAPEIVDPPERRYAVNVLIDHGELSHPEVVLESNPSYENLFGRIEYRQALGSIATDFTLIRAGALHRANGGILVLRAEALAANPLSWSFLKSALRDGEIRIEELQRAQAPAIAGAPQPLPIPLDVKVVIVGAPRWHAIFFGGDPEFYVYFKIKADIDSDMQASPHNLGIYAGIIRDMARERGLEGASEGATRRLLGVAARWAQRRDRLTARIELIEDLVAEAATRDAVAKSRELTETAVMDSVAARRRRNSQIEDRILRSILQNEQMIATTGAAIGQVNALTVYDLGDRRFGTPVRVTARASVGRAGIINIERDVALGGPIQQKGAMVLQGVLTGLFAQTRPLSFTCSLTFEQSYGGVEGDSASMAELIAVLSDLAQLPLRQDVAITGSVSQAGMAQAIGGAYTKIEGFFRLCAEKPGGLTGTQGVIVPESNREHVMVHGELEAALKAGRFHIWSVATMQEAAELLLGTPAGAADASGNYPPNTIFNRAAARLAAFDRILAERRGA